MIHGELQECHGRPLEHSAEIDRLSQLLARHLADPGKIRGECLAIPLRDIGGGLNRFRPLPAEIEGSRSYPGKEHVFGAGNVPCQVHRGHGILCRTVRSLVRRQCFDHLPGEPMLPLQGRQRDL